MGDAVRDARSAVWESTPTGTRVTLVLAALACLAVLVTPFRFGAYLVAAAFLYSAWRVHRAAARGLGPPFGRLIALAIGLWGVGHVSEIATRAQPGYDHLFTPADALFLALLPGTVAVSLIVFGPELRRVEAAATARMAVDALLVAVSAVTVQWVVLLRPMAEDHRLPTLAGWYAVLFVACLGLTFAAQLFGAVRTGDPGVRWLAVATGLLTLGVAFWSVGIVDDPHDQRVGPALLVLAIMVMPLAQACPAPKARDEEQDGGQHELLLPVLVAAGAWVVCAPVILWSGQPAALVALLVVTMTLIAVRVIVVGIVARRQTWRLRGYAFTDALTGLGNRRAATGRLEAGEGWLMLVDLDGFKEINERLGHEVGDRLLAGFARRLAAAVPESAHLARLGGDEFMICLDPCSPAAARSVAHRVLEGGVDDDLPVVGMSIGAAPFALTDPAAVALRSADVALRSAKRAGGHRVEFVDGAMLDTRVRALEVIGRLRAGAVDAMRVDYQPIVALDRPHRPTVAVEALARWNDPLLGDVAPAEFIPLAEETGVIGPLGLRVLSDTLAQLERWHLDGVRVHATVNVSWAQLAEPGIPEAMEDIILRHPHGARWLVLEATESGFSTDEAGVAAFARMRELGVSVAIDDFGVGASSLTRLRTLPVDVLKLDRELLRGVGSDPHADAVLAAIAGLGRELGMVTVAEGVEDEATCGAVRDAGIAHGQGWLFARAGAPDAVGARATGGRFVRRGDGPSRGDVVPFPRRG